MRCLMVDDNAAFLAVAKSILDGPEFSIVGGAMTAAEAMRQMAELDPDVMLIDIDLGEDDGFALSARIAGAVGNGRPKLVLVSAHPEEEFADLIAESPAVGFIAKEQLSAARLAAVLADG